MQVIVCGGTAAENLLAVDVKLCCAGVRVTHGEVPLAVDGHSR